MRRSQIAMESLMVYGLAILVVMLAVAALIYFDVLDIGGYLPDKCDFQPQNFACEDYQAISDPPSVKVELTNQVGVGITNVQVIAADIAGDSGCTGVTGVPAGTWANGASHTLEFTGCSLAKGDKTDISFEIKYKKIGKTLDHLSVGTVKIKSQ